MKVLVIDDHVLIRDALRGVLKEVNDDAVIVEASDCRQAMRLIKEHPDIDLILLDLNLPDRNGFEVLADLCERHPAISTVVLSAFNDRENMVRALDVGERPRHGRHPRNCRSLYSSNDPASLRWLANAREAGRVLSLQFVEHQATSQADVERIFANLKAGEVDAYSCARRTCAWIFIRSFWSSPGNIVCHL
jgi:CheY-like chemotaxis protein